MIEITKAGANLFKFSLKTREGNILLNSIAYPSTEQLKAVVTKLSRLTAHHMAFERQTNHEGKFFFQLRDLDGKIIGKSQLYNSEAGMENGIKNLKTRIAALENADGL